MGFEEQTEEKPFTPEQEEVFRQIAVQHARKHLEGFADTGVDEEDFVSLPSAAIAAFHLERFDEAEKYARKSLALAPRFEANWNFGNAIHLGHTVLGLLALRENRTTVAIQELRKSGDTRGSPQLNSFGPTMQLAKELLKQGHSKPVLAYLKQCRSFWKSGTTWLGLWERKVIAGETPNFFQRSYG
jgi:tetratricopeptide (TPR) repeat protein